MVISIDLSFMYDRDVVVHCKTEEDSDELINAVEERFAVKESRACFWRHNWNRHREATCYRINLCEDGSISYGFCNVDFYRQDGKKIIEYSELTTVVDFGEIESPFGSIADVMSALF